MISYSRRVAALFALVATCATGACKKADETALQQDTTLSRDLARAGTDTSVQPELKDVPPASAPAPAPATPRSTTPPRPKATVPKSTTPAPKATPPAPTPAPAAESKGEVSKSGSIAAGTTLALSSTEKVCTNTNKVGDRFSATVTQAVAGSNGASIPAGSKVIIEVTNLHRSENANDRIVMGFRVVSITIGDKVYYPEAEVATAEVDRVRSSTSGDAAKKVAGGAIAGAIIGQIIGRDRKGTLIGAAAGAAAGGAAAAATADHDGCVNNGAAITVKLNAPLTVTVV
jgi:hypothetical protein